MIIKTVFTNWNAARIFRAGLGIITVVYAIVRHDGNLGWFGGLLLFMAVSNTGCCGAGGCNIPKGKPSKSTEEISFEQVE